MGVEHDKSGPVQNGVMPVLRVARAVASLEHLQAFYIDGLGFRTLYQFRDHAGFDGLILGLPGARVHLEFTISPHGPPSRAPDPDDLLVLYMEEAEAVSRIEARLNRSGFSAVRSANPFWDREGRTFVDPEGHRVVVQGASWPF